MKSSTERQVPTERVPRRARRWRRLAVLLALAWSSGCALDPPPPQTGRPSLPSELGGEDVVASADIDPCEACRVGELCCGGACVDLAVDPANCGACGHACSAMPGVAEATCVEGFCRVASCAPGYLDCDGDLANGCEPDDSGLSSQCPAASCRAVLQAGNSPGDGVYWIDPDGAGSTAVLCDMTSDTGGWTLLLKATTGTTFAYDAEHWTSSTTLNPEDLTRADADAKYDAFNRLPVTDLRAVWSDFDDGGQPWVWLESGVWQPGTTALAGFQTFESMGLPQNSPTFDPRFFSSQADMACAPGQEIGRYGINLNPTDLCTGCRDGCSGQGFVRWGYRFNENGCCDWGSDDAGGGIGLLTLSGQRLSAGDWFSCCGAAGSNRRARVEIWGR